MNKHGAMVNLTWQGKNKVLEEHLSQFQSVNCNSKQLLDWPGIETGPPWSAANNQLPEPWQSLFIYWVLYFASCAYFIYGTHHYRPACQESLAIFSAALLNVTLILWLPCSVSRSCTSSQFKNVVMISYFQKCVLLSSHQ